MLARISAVLILPVILLAGCTARWVNPDGSAAQAARIDQALIDCRVREIEDELHAQEVQAEATVMITPNAAERQSLEDSREIARRVN